MRHGILILVVVLGVAADPAFAADDYFPLRTGGTWTYHSSDMLVPWLGMEILGPVDFQGSTDVHVLWDLGELGEGYLFLHETASGDVALHGTLLGDDMDVYDPPRPLLDMPLTPGRTWEYTGQVSHYTAGELTETYTDSYSYEVLQPQTLTVPAGTFEAIGVQETYTEPPVGQSRFPWHESAGLKKKAPDVYWYALDIGWVFIDSEPVYELESYSIPVVQPSSSWSSVKSLFGREQ
jgi:hypothetical protein